MRHIPVLKGEVISSLNLSSNDLVIDCTLGDAGHAQAILESKSDVELLGIDADPEAILRSKKFLDKYLDQVIFVRDSFSNIAQISRKNNFEPNAILFDLGWSTPQFEERGRGFSFQKNENLDMRYDAPIHNGAGAMTAADVVNKYSVQDLTLIFSRYGEEKKAKQIAKEIAKVRSKKKIKTTQELADLIEGVYKNRRGKIHPATKVFQALRIEVNDEFGVLRQGLKDAVEVLKKDGRLCVISFHSGEDRIIKKFIDSHPDLKSFTKKPITASSEELEENPRARSAKLRVAIKQ